MNSTRGVSALALSFVVLFTCSAFAQTRVTGRVLDQTGLALPGVTIDLLAKGTRLTTATDQDGRYQFERVPQGQAEVTFRLLNFSALRRAIVVSADVNLSDVILSLAINADVVVTGTNTFRNIADSERPAENLIGIAAAASQGAVTAAQVAGRPVMRAGEVLETVPGMIISQHSGEGKANQYYLRGFNLDHGTDFSTTVAGVPVNTPTGAHAHGYADLNFLIPELVSGVQYKKGPYFADEGDFSAAGAANITYVNRLKQPEFNLSAGNDGWARLFAAGSPRVRGGVVLAAVEASHSNGPWVRPDDYRSLNTVLRYSRGDTQNGLMLTNQTYRADWNSSDQIPVRAVENGLVPRFGSVDSTDGGETSRETVAVEWMRSANRASIRASGYVIHQTLNLFSNFTYYLDDPEHGDQFEQAEHRTAVGSRIAYKRLGRLFDRHTESAIGLQVRRDWLSPVGLYHTETRQRLATIRQDAVDQTTTGAYAQSEIEWFQHLRTTVGVRADAYQFSVTSDTTSNSGSGVAYLLSPKFGAVFGPWASTELYANFGDGFHSNDARGAVIRFDPSTSESVQAVTPLVRARGGEVGLRTVRIRGLQSTVALWYLGLDSELLFVGDAGTTEVGRPSSRTGIEWTNYARLSGSVTLDVDVAFTRARFSDDDASGRRIPGALDRVASAGITVEPRGAVFGSVRVRHFGPRPLVEDASVTSQSTTLINGELGWRLSPKARITIEGFNLLDAQVSDIDYYYRSRLPGEPERGIEDIHLHPTLPRSARLAIHFSF